MAERSFLSDIMRRIAGAGRRSSDETAEELDLVDLCHSLMGDEGEALGLVRANTTLDRLEALTDEDQLTFFTQIALEFGVDDTALQSAIEAWQPGDVDAARNLHFAAEPQSQGLIRALNLLPGATARLVALRAKLLTFLREHKNLRGLDEDFQHLFSSWFSRGFLEIQRIDWSSTPAEILEKIIEYEAVHQINGWEDLRQRVADPDRRLFAFFHPAMPSEPLIFVEVALTTDIPGAIEPILNVGREQIDPETATSAVFYSISNCQKGLRGISFGNFLIKQVVAELQRELPNLSTFVTLSPVPALRKWASLAVDDTESVLQDEDREALQSLETGQMPTPEFSAHLAALYLTKAKRAKGTAYDPVAHFHLGNGAILHKVHPNADLSPRGLENSWGVMVNYLYDGAQIETHHQAYATTRDVAASAEVHALARN
ncbi:MAG: malonyl-CoA decarboxylase [Pikeienuella sp.]